MKIVPMAAPVGVPTIGRGSPASGQSGDQAFREKAIAMMTQTTPVQNPNQVAPEEMSAIIPPSNQGQSDTSEAPAVDTAQAPSEAPKAKEDQLSTQYAILARKEKALRAKIQAQEGELRAKEAAIQAREQAIAAKDTEYQSRYISKDRLNTDTWNVLAEAGLTYDQLTQLALNPPPAENPAQKAALAKLQAEILELKNAQDQSKKTFENQQAQSYQQALNQIRIETRNLVSSDPAFETIKATNSVSDVVELIEKTFKLEGVLLSVEEAAQAVEDHLVDEAVKYSQLNKVQQRLQARTSTSQQAQKPQQNAQQQTMKTLTNSVTSTRKLSARDRAIAAFKGEKF